jgi:hypothetical protein
MQARTSIKTMKILKNVSTTFVSSVLPARAGEIDAVTGVHWTSFIIMMP